MSDANDPMNAWREALAQGQQMFLNYCLNQGQAQPAPQFAEWWSKFGASKAGAGPAAAPYLAACDHFFGLTRTFMEQLSAQPNAKDTDPLSRAKNFAAALEAWFQQSVAPGNTAWTRALELPGLGATREQQELWQRILALAQRYQELQATLATQWAAIGREAAQQFSAEVAAAQQSGASFANLKSLYDKWIDNAEKAYSAQVHQESYARVLADLTNTLNEIKARQRELMESWTQQFDLPTRSELNTVHSRIKAMQRQLQELREAATGKAAAKPRRAPGKSKKR